MDERGDVTRLLEAARAGDRAALERVYPLVHDELHRIACANVRSHAPSTLQTTALVHEAYLRLIDREAPIESRAHFFHLAAAAMRSILIDRARAAKAEKRGGNRVREPLHDALAWFEERSIDLLALDEALHALESVDTRKRRLVDLRFFAGLTMESASELLGISLATAEREWAFARAWLFRRMGGASFAN